MTTRGERLADYLRRQTGGQRGWQAALVAKSGVKRQTLTKWTSAKFDGYPDLETLAIVASALGVKPYEMVAAIDGDVEEPTVEQARRIAREEALAVFREEMAAGRLQVLPGGQPEQTRASGSPKGSGA